MQREKAVAQMTPTRKLAFTFQAWVLGGCTVVWWVGKYGYGNNLFANQIFNT